MLATVAALFVITQTSLSFAKYSGGTGEPNDPYRIATPNDLNDIGNHVEDFNKCFVLMNDINLADYNGTRFNMIGDFDDRFTGVFDGNNHTVHNFSWSAPGFVRGIGLFGVVGVVEENGQIHGELRNLHLANVDVKIGSCRFVGALAGFNDGRISNCSSMGKVSVGQIEPAIIGERTGGLVGYNDSGIIENCHCEGIVSGTYDIGGLVGINLFGVIRSSYSLCQVTGDGPIGGLAGDNCGIIDSCFSGGVVSGNWGVGGLVGDNAIFTDFGAIKNSFAYAEVCGTERVGGLVGHNDGHYYSHAQIISSYATGNVSGNLNVGGLVGYTERANIANCYSAGSVDGNDCVGGLVAFDSEGSFTSCFWDSDVNPDVNGIGNANEPNVVGKPTAEMMAESTFTDAGWDFVEVWDIGEDQTYPFLRVYPPGDLNHDSMVNFIDVAILADHWLESWD
jgi:hypothetical protein